MGLRRVIANLAEDLFHPRPRFSVEINGRKVTGRLLSIGQLRDLTKARAFDAIDAFANASARAEPLGPEEQATPLERLIMIAAAALRRPASWVERRCTSEEVAQVVAAVMRASSPAAKEGKSGPPA